MELEKILNEKLVDLNMNVSTKEEAIKHLSQMLKDADYIKDVDTFIEDIYLREAEGITGIGNFIAIPHGKSDSVEQVGIAIGKVEHEIEWETIDEQGVRLIFLFAVSNNSEYEMNHMRLLSQIAGKLGNDDAVEQIMKASCYEDLLKVFAQ